jgi:hypothetical protein
MSRSIITLTLAGAITLANVGSAGASGVVTPPAGTPNLALMVLQPADLVPGSVLGDQAYIAPPTGFTAQYGSEFTSASTPDGVNYSLVLDYVALAPDVSTATTFFNVEDAYVDSRKGRKLITKNIIKAAGKKAHLKSKNVKFTGEQSAGIGTGSYVETITVKAKHQSVQEVYLIFDDGTVCTSLELVGEVNKKVPESDATTLATAIVAHIGSVLAVGGTTGASGTT